MYNRLANSNESFAQDDKLLYVNASTDTFTVSNDTRFGKVVLVTTYPTDENAIERAVDFTNIRDINFENYTPRNYQGDWFTYLSGGVHSANKMAFFYDVDGRLRVKISPQPQADAIYRVRYSIGDWAKNANLSESPILTQFHHLFEIRTCKDVLYMCEWDGMTAEARALKLTEMKPNFNEQEERYAMEFDLYLRNMTTSKLVKRLAWNEWD